MTTNKDLCTSLEESKLLAETGIMAGVEADGCYIDGDFYNAHDVYYVDNNQDDRDWATVHAENSDDENDCLSYRLDKILAVLPEECFKPIPFHDEVYLSKRFSNEWVDNFIDLIHKAIHGDVRGQAAANAAAELAHLLWSNDLIKGENDDKTN